MWPIELVFKINIFITGRGKCFKNRKKPFTLIFNKIIPVQSFVFSENMACQFVVLVVCACIQNIPGFDISSIETH